MRISNAVHEARPWRIREIAPDFNVEDVWALPVHGGAEDFQTLLEIIVSLDPANSESLPTRILWRARDRLGAWFDLGRVSAPIDHGRADAGRELPIPGTTETSLIDRLPEDLSNTAADLIFDSTPFAPLYRTDDEYAAELSNRTMHAVLHLTWVGQGGGRYRGQMAVYVKPRGSLGKGYVANQAIPALDYLPSTHASDRTSVEYPHFAVKRVRIDQLPWCREMVKVCRKVSRPRTAPSATLFLQRPARQRARRARKP